jgi:PAS domain S-box-containing protein
MPHAISRNPAALRRAKKTIAGLHAPEHGHEHEHTTHILQQLTFNLQERVKELNCLYLISNIVEDDSNSLQDILEKTVDIVPDAWQYPEITCGRIIVHGMIFETRGFAVTPWVLRQPIVVHGSTIGFLEICYREERPVKDEGPFLKEERSLINVLAERLGEIIERKEAQAALLESEMKNRALLDAMPDLMFQVDKSGTLLGFHAGRFAALQGLLAEVVGKNIFILSDEKGVLPRRLLDQAMMHAQIALATGRPQVFEQHINLDGTGRDFELRMVIMRQHAVLGIVRDITARKRLQKEIIEISGREQRRIGQDLHDSLCQQLAGIGFLCKAIETKIAEGLPVAVDEAAEVVNHLEEAITLTRGYARGLNPVRLESNGLVYALSELAVTTEKIYGIACRFEYNKNIIIKDNAAALHLYRIVQEALNNAIKHGGPTRIEITILSDGNTHRLAVQDNGRGFSAGAPQGMGLNIMEYRASMIGAELAVDSRPGGGTTVTCLFQNRNDT